MYIYIYLYTNTYADYWKTQKTIFIGIKYMYVSICFGISGEKTL